MAVWPTLTINGQVYSNVTLTPVQLAAKIHTDLATHFHHAVDARKKTPMGKDHALQPGDVVKIVATK